MAVYDRQWKFSKEVTKHCSVISEKIDYLVLASDAILELTS